MRPSIALLLDSDTIEEDKIRCKLSLNFSILAIGQDQVENSTFTRVPDAKIPRVKPGLSNQTKLDYCGLFQ